VRASPGAEKIQSALHPEKSWFIVSGRGFDSRHLHERPVCRGEPPRAAPPR